MEQPAVKPFTRILVPLDGSFFAEQALPFAQAVAGPVGELVLLGVVPWAEDQADVQGRLLATAEEVRERSESAVREALRRAARTWLGDRSRVDFAVAAGDPAEQILRLAGSRAADLIIMTTHGRGAVGRAVFGSVADRVARASPLPVLFAHPRPEIVEPAAAEIRRLVVPLDGSRLAEEALPVASGLARRLSRPVHLVRAVDPAAAAATAAGLGVPALPLSQDACDEIYEAVEADARQTLETAAAAIHGAGVATTWEILRGSPYFAIAAAMQPGDLVVMTSHGRSGVMRWLLGSVAEKLVRSGPAPVLLVPVGARPTTGPSGRRRS